MNSDAKISNEFWVPRIVEMGKFKSSVQKHRTGFGGAITLIGVHGAGKTTITRHAVNHLFNKKNVLWVDAPAGGSTSMADFSLALQTASKTYNDLEGIFNNMGYETCVVFNDIELWWERHADGDAVLNKIIELIQLYGNKILFVLNCNSHAFSIIKKIVPLEDNCLSIIKCEPFNTSELKQLILNRHKSSGIDFNYKNTDEESVSQLSLSLLFNRYFNVTKGIPGVALNTWKSNIEEAKNDTLYIKKPLNPKHEMLLEMQPDWLIILSLSI